MSWIAWAYLLGCIWVLGWLMGMHTEKQRTTVEETVPFEWNLAGICVLFWPIIVVLTVLGFIFMLIVTLLMGKED